MKRCLSYLPIILLIISSSSLFAQYTDVINSNRPGVSRSAFAVGVNVLQFETGPYYVKEKHTPLKYDVSGFGIDFAARFGLLFEQLELNLEGTYQNDKLTNYRSTSGIVTEDKRANFKNLSIGAKYLLYDPYKNADDKPNLYSYHANHRFKWKSLIPAVSIYAGGTYDTADNPYIAPGIEGFSPKVMVATQNNFSNGWVFVINLIKDRIGTEDSDFQYIVTLTHSFNPQWVIFGETHGIMSDYYADNLFRVGGAYLWTKDFQLDTAVTFNAKDTPSVLSVNLGASYRFDWHEDKIDTIQEDDAAKQSRKDKSKKRREGKIQNDFDGVLK